MSVTITCSISIGKQKYCFVGVCKTVVFVSVLSLHGLSYLCKVLEFCTKAWNFGAKIQNFKENFQKINTIVALRPHDQTSSVVVLSHGIS